MDAIAMLHSRRCSTGNNKMKNRDVPLCIVGLHGSTLISPFARKPDCATLRRWAVPRGIFLSSEISIEISSISLKSHCLGIFSTV